MKDNRSIRPDGRFVATTDFVHHLLRQEPALAFDPGCTVTEFGAWKRAVRGKLRELLAFPVVPRQPKPRLLSEILRAGYRLQRWELYPEPHSVVPFIMLVPDGASARQPAPAVLCFPGTDHPKEMLCGEKWTGPWKNPWGWREFMARQFAQAGFVAVAFDNPGTARLADGRERSGRRASDQLLWLGRSYEGLSTFQKLAALRWLKTLPFVDPQRMAACGHSLGAKPALLLGLLDDDIRAVVWNNQASSWRSRELATDLVPVAPWHYVPGFIRWFDYTDLMAALAPAPLLITEGGRLEDHARIRKAYRLAGAPQQVRVTFMPRFAKASARTRRRMPRHIPPSQYPAYANFDGDHYFKGEVAVPWLQDVLDDGR